MSNALNLKSAVWQAAVVTALCVGAGAGETSQDDATLDWPCFRGPGANSRSLQTGIKKDWGKGLNKIWEFEIGNTTKARGFSQPVVSRGQLVVMGHEFRKPKAAGAPESEAPTPPYDIVYCLDAKADKPTVLWATKMEAPTFAMEYGNGAYSTPTIESETVYTLTTQGRLSALSMKDGKILWSRDLKKEEGARSPNFGFASSPVIVGNLLVLGNTGATAIAFDKTSGKTVWKQDFSCHLDYGTPVLRKLQGKDQLVFFVSLGDDEKRRHPYTYWSQVAGLDPQTGKELWKVECGESGMGPGTTPLVVEDTIFVTSRFGCKLIQVGMDGPKELWANDVVKSSYSDGILVDGYLYTTSGGVKFPGGTPFKCVDFKTGKECWSKEFPDVYYAHMGNPLAVTYVDGCLLALACRGDLMLIKPDPKAFTVLSSFEAIKETPDVFRYTQPVVAQGRVYVRGECKLYCYDLMK